jgi:hypothetical protein
MTLLIYEKYFWYFAKEPFLFGDVMGTLGVDLFIPFLSLLFWPRAPPSPPVRLNRGSNAVLTGTGNLAPKIVVKAQDLEKFGAGPKEMLSILTADGLTAHPSREVRTRTKSHPNPHSNPHP